MTELENFTFKILYLASGITLTWFKPIQSTLNSTDYHLWLHYWSILSFTVLIEQNFFPSYTSNFGYYFFRTLFFFYLSNKSLSNPFQDSSYMLRKIGEQTDIKILVSLLSDDSEIHFKSQLHLWAPNPKSIAGLALCKIEELSRDENFSIAEQKFLVNNALEKILGMMDSEDEGLSVNALLCVLVFSEKTYLKGKLLCLEVFRRLEGLMKHASRQVNQTCMRLCANLYCLNKQLQTDFVNLRYHSYLLANLRNTDSLCVLETLDHIFLLITTNNNQICAEIVKVLYLDGLAAGLEAVEQSHYKKKEIKDRIETLKGVLADLQ